MAINKEVWERIRVLFETGKSLKDIELDTGINKGTISKKAKKEGWEKNKIQPLKADITDYEEKKATLDNQKGNLLERVAKLSDFEITVLNEVIEEEKHISSLITSTSTLAIIRTNQLLTKNQTYEKINVGDGMQQLEPRELNPTDLKNISDTIDKLSITTKVNDRFSTSANVAIQNNQEQTNNQPTQINIVRDV